MINPYTGQDDQQDMGMPGLPPSYAASQAQPLPPQQAPPELQEAMQALQIADQVLGPSQSQQPTTPGLPQMPAPAATPTGQQDQLRQQQFSGFNQARGLEAQQGQLDQQTAGIKQDLARDQAAFDAERAAQEQLKQEETRALSAKYEQAQIQAKTASDHATQVWASAKPTEWLEQGSGTQLVTLLSMALAHGFDQLNASQGGRSNLGQQATAVVNQRIDQHRAQEIERIGGLKQQAQVAAGKVEQMSREKAAAIAQIEDKYAGIEKALELQARAQRSAMGMDEARINGDQVVIDRTKRALEAEQRRIDAVNGFVDRAMQMEISRRKGTGKGKGGPADPTDPYAGMTPGQRDNARRKDEELAIPNLDGTPAGKAKTRAEAAKIRKGQEATATFIDNALRMKEFIEREGTIQVPLVDSGARREREMLTTALAGNLTIMNETGILQPGEYNRYAAVIQPGALEKNAKAGELLGKFAKKAEEDYARKVRSQGVVGETPAEQPPTTPTKLPEARPPGTSKFSPEDIQMMQWIQRQPPNNPDAQEAANYLRMKYGAASGI